MPNPFMHLERLTEWHAVGEIGGHRAIVCDDLNPAGFRLRQGYGGQDVGRMGYSFVGIDEVCTVVPDQQTSPSADGYVGRTGTSKH